MNLEMLFEMKVKLSKIGEDGVFSDIRSPDTRLFMSCSGSWKICSLGVGKKGGAGAR